MGRVNLGMVDSEEYRSDDTSLNPGFVCPLCGCGLMAVPIGAAVTFHCRNGHELPLQDLLQAQSLVLRHGLQILLREWESQLKALRKTAVEARANGFSEVADIFGRQVQHIEARIEHVREAVAKEESKTLLPWQQDQQNRG